MRDSLCSYQIGGKKDKGMPPDQRMERRITVGKGREGRGESQGCPKPALEARVVAASEGRLPPVPQRSPIYLPDQFPDGETVKRNRNRLPLPVRKGDRLPADSVFAN